MNKEILVKSGWTGKSFSDYVNQSLEFFNGGNCNKANFKRAGEALNYAYDLARETIQKAILETPQEERDEDWNEKYWSAIHYCHQWRQKHSDAFISSYPLSVACIKKVVSLKLMMKTVMEKKESI